MKIIEKYIMGKKGSLVDCEDGMVIKDNLIAVVDGVTSKGGKKFNGIESGAFAKEVLCRVFNENDIEKLSCEELFITLNSILREESDKCYDDLEYIEYPRASVIVYNAYYNEIWCYGDCQCIINGTPYLHEKAIDTLNSELREFYLEYALLNGSKVEDFFSNDVGRTGILDNFKKQYMFENKDIPFGYPVLNGFSVNEDMIVRHAVKENDEIVLSSDGYPFLQSTLEESEKKLKEVLENDPLCFKIYKTTKGIKEGNISFDDRCYCRFVV